MYTPYLLENATVVKTLGHSSIHLVQLLWFILKTFIIFFQSQWCYEGWIIQFSFTFMIKMSLIYEVFIC